jgi:hypothetical protein
VGLQGCLRAGTCPAHPRAGDVVSLRASFPHALPVAPCMLVRGVVGGVVEAVPGRIDTAGAGVVGVTWGGHWGLAGSLVMVPAVAAALEA